MTDTQRLIGHAFPVKQAPSAYHCATPTPQLGRVQDPFGKLLVRPFSKSQTMTRTITATVETSGARISQQQITEAGEE